MTGVKLELVTDPDMSLFIDMGFIDGVSVILHPYAKANKAKGKKVDKEKPMSWMKYLDANNLHGWSMIQCLPTGGFELIKLVPLGDWEKLILEKEDKQEISEKTNRERLSE